MTDSKRKQNYSTELDPDESYLMQNEIKENTDKESYSEEHNITIDSELKEVDGKESLLDGQPVTNNKLMEYAGKELMLTEHPLIYNKQKQDGGKKSLSDVHPDLQGELKPNNSKEYHSQSKHNLPPPPQPLVPPPNLLKVVHPTDAKNGGRSGMPRSDTASHTGAKEKATAPSDMGKQSLTHGAGQGTSEKNGNTVGSINAEAASRGQRHDQTHVIRDQKIDNGQARFKNGNFNVSAMTESKQRPQHGGIGKTSRSHQGNNNAGIRKAEVGTITHIDTAAQHSLSEINKINTYVATRNTIVERSTDEHSNSKVVRHKPEDHAKDNTKRGDEKHKTDPHSGVGRHSYNQPQKQISLPKGTTLSKTSQSYKTIDRTGRQIKNADLRNDDKSNQGATEKNKFYKQADESKLTNMKLTPDNGSTSGTEFVIVLRRYNNETRKDNPGKKSRKFLKQGAETDDALFGISKDVDDEDKYTGQEKRIPGNEMKPNINKIEGPIPGIQKQPRVGSKRKYSPLKKYANMRSGSKYQRIEGSEKRQQVRPSKQIHEVKKHVIMTSDAKYGRTNGSTRKTFVHKSKLIPIKKKHTNLATIAKHHGSSRPERKPEPIYSRHILKTRKSTEMRSNVMYHRTIGSDRKIKVHHAARLTAQQPTRRLLVSREFIRSYSKPQQNDRKRETPHISNNYHQERTRRDKIYKDVSGLLVSAKLDKDKIPATGNSDIDMFDRQLRKTPLRRFPPIVTNSEKGGGNMLPEDIKMVDGIRMRHTNADEQHHESNKDGHHINIDAQLNYDDAKKKIPQEVRVGVNRPDSMHSGVIDIGTDYEVLNNGGKYKPIVHKNGNSYKIGFENAEKLDTGVKKGGLLNYGEERLYSKPRKGTDAESMKERTRRKYYIKIYPDNFGAYDRHNPHGNMYGNNGRRPIHVAPKHMNVAAEKIGAEGQPLNNNFGDKDPTKLIRAGSSNLAELPQIWQKKLQQRPEMDRQRSVSAVITQPANGGRKGHGHTDLWWWRLVEKAMKQSKDDTPPSESSPLTPRHNEQFNKVVYSHGKQQSIVKPEQNMMGKTRHRVPIHNPDTYEEHIQRKNDENINDIARSNLEGNKWREYGLIAGEGEVPRQGRQNSWHGEATESGRRTESTTVEAMVIQADGQAERGKSKSSI